MKKRVCAISLSLCCVLTAALAGCSSTASQPAASTPPAAAETTAPVAAVLEDGQYSAAFQTDSSMFHVNEAMNGRGILTVKDGKMSIHVSLASKKIVNLFVGTAADAKKDGAVLLEPTTDSVTYEDGTTEEVYGFDIPVAALDQDFSLAIIGTKNTWYDHTVQVTDVQPLGDAEETDTGRSPEELALEDADYLVDVTLEGGSGKASITSPTGLKMENGKAIAVIEWSSPNYDYMIVDGETYLPVNTEGNSIFEIPVERFDAPFTITADTTAMSTPHEIEYSLCFDSASIQLQ